MCTTKTELKHTRTYRFGILSAHLGEMKVILSLRLILYLHLSFSTPLTFSGLSPKAFQKAALEKTLPYIKHQSMVLLPV